MSPLLFKYCSYDMSVWLKGERWSMITSWIWHKSLVLAAGIHSPCWAYVATYIWHQLPLLGRSLIIQMTFLCNSLKRIFPKLMKQSRIRYVAWRILLLTWLSHKLSLNASPSHWHLNMLIHGTLVIQTPLIHGAQGGETSNNNIVQFYGYLRLRPSFFIHWAYSFYKAWCPRDL